MNGYLEANYDCTCRAGTATQAETKWGNVRTMRSAFMREWPSFVDRAWLSRGSLLGAALVLNTEALVLLAYVLLSPGSITDPLILVYPLLWINVSL